MVEWHVLELAVYMVDNLASQVVSVIFENVVSEVLPAFEEIWFLFVERFDDPVASLNAKEFLKQLLFWWADRSPKFLGRLVFPNRVLPLCSLKQKRPRSQYKFATSELALEHDTILLKHILYDCLYSIFSYLLQDQNQRVLAQCYQMPGPRYLPVKLHFHGLILSLSY